MKYSVNTDRFITFFWIPGILFKNSFDISQLWSCWKNWLSITIIKIWKTKSNKIEFSLKICLGMSVYWTVLLTWSKSISFLISFFLRKKNSIRFKSYIFVWLQQYSDENVVFFTAFFVELFINRSILFESFTIRTF